MEHLNIAELSILLVEPSQAQQKIICQQLVNEGVSTITTAVNLAEAKASAAQFAPDLMVSAMHFVDGTALELLAHVKTCDSLQDTQFMLVSSEESHARLEVFRQAGVVAILPKPFDLAHFHSALSAAAQLFCVEELELDCFDAEDVRVLLVDDSTLSRGIIRRTLNNLGIQQIVEASDGKQAIFILQEQEFDLVITDYNMPEVDGCKLTRYIRRHSEQSHIPVLMVSSNAGSAQLANVTQYGVNALCDKPFEPQLVKHLLQQLLGE
ncbi:response regulator [Shewanella sp. NFH-SH190041]|uniref:response regulator n=1 Tax=Shewanella sp. NFH-SH190041 TaxID=2950245 RepID=UPI0021C39576|nr:response regulator [Shewanella sp. NFH-SH190041]BDM63191.1 response regulator [Shewanella sp. NFH-SH190041]